MRGFLSSKDVMVQDVEDQIRHFTLDDSGEESSGEETDHEKSVSEVSDNEEIAVGNISKHVKDVTATGGNLKGMFVVSFSNRIRRLHQVGRCHRVPGVDYAEYEIMGAEEPPAHTYTARCGHCWSNKARTSSSRASETSSSSASSGSSASSER